MEFVAQVKGMQRHLRKIKRFTPKVQRKILRSAFGAASGPIKNQLRRGIRSKIKRKGLLAKSIATKVKSYPSGHVVVIIGARDRRIGDENPGKYFHLADLGTKPHEIPRSQGGSIRHPGSRPENVRSDAFRIGQPKVTKAFIDRVEKKIRELAKQ